MSELQTSEDIIELHATMLLDELALPSPNSDNIKAILVSEHVKDPIAVLQLVELEIGQEIDIITGYGWNPLGSDYKPTFHTFPNNTLDLSFLTLKEDENIDDIPKFKGITFDVDKVKGKEYLFEEFRKARLSGAYHCSNPVSYEQNMLDMLTSKLNIIYPKMEVNE